MKTDDGVAVASAGPYAYHLYLASDRSPAHQHLITQFLEARCSLSPSQHGQRKHWFSKKYNKFALNMSAIICFHRVTWFCVFLLIMLSSRNCTLCCRRCCHVGVTGCWSSCIGRRQFSSLLLVCRPSSGRIALCTTLILHTLWACSTCIRVHACTRTRSMWIGHFVHVNHQIMFQLRSFAWCFKLNELESGIEWVQALAGISCSALCCHSNETHCKSIANPPNSAQLEGTTYHSPKLHPALCSSVVMWRGTDRQTHRCAWPIHILPLLCLTWNVINM